MVIWTWREYKYKYNYDRICNNYIFTRLHPLYTRMTVQVIVSPVRMYDVGYYGLVVVTPRPPPRPQTFIVIIIT